MTALWYLTLLVAGVSLIAPPLAVLALPAFVLALVLLAVELRNMPARSDR